MSTQREWKRCGDEYAGTQFEKLAATKRTVTEAASGRQRCGCVSITSHDDLLHGNVHTIRYILRNGLCNRDAERVHTA